MGVKVVLVYEVLNCLIIRPWDRNTDFAHSSVRPPVCLSVSHENKRREKTRVSESVRRPTFFSLNGQRSELQTAEAAQLQKGSRIMCRHWANIIFC